MTTQYTNQTIAIMLITTTKGEYLTVYPQSSIKFEGEIKKQNYSLGFNRNLKK